MNTYWRAAQFVAGVDKEKNIPTSVKSCKKFDMKHSSMCIPIENWHVGQKWQPIFKCSDTEHALRRVLTNEHGENIMRV